MAQGEACCASLSQLSGSSNLLNPFIEIPENFSHISRTPADTGHGFFLHLWPGRVNAAPGKRESTGFVARLAGHMPQDGEQGWPLVPVTAPVLTLSWLRPVVLESPPVCIRCCPAFPSLGDELWSHSGGHHFPSPRHYWKELFEGHFVLVEKRVCA